MSKTGIFELTDDERKRLEADIGKYGGSNNVLLPMDQDHFAATNASPVDPNKKRRYKATVPDLLIAGEPEWELKVVKWL